MKILSSASKIVLILFCITACVCVILRVLSTQDFMLLATGVFAYYFGNRPQPTTTTS